MNRRVRNIRSGEHRADLCWRALCGIVVLCLASTTIAQPRVALENEIKAAFIFNFIKFVDWPPQAFNRSDTLIVGVIGDDPFGTVLDQELAGKVVRDKRLAVHRFHRLQDLTECHILSVSASEEPHLAEILRVVDNVGVLTISDIDQFAARGGIIGFTREGNRVRFEINTDAARQGGLRISSQVLNLATKVIGSPEMP